MKKRPTRRPAPAALLPTAPALRISAGEWKGRKLHSPPGLEPTRPSPGILKEAVLAKRWEFDAQPAWGAERKGIWDTFERAVAAGFHPKLPDEAIIYAP